MYIYIYILLDELDSTMELVMHPVDQNFL